MSTDDRRPSEDPQLRRIQRLLRDGRDELAPLPRAQADRLWAGIDARIDADEPSAATADTDPDVSDRARADGASDPVPATAVTDPRPPAWLTLAAAAAVALLVGVGLGIVLAEPATEDGTTTLATIDLDPLAAGAEPRTATLLSGEAGRSIELDLAGLPPVDGFHEVWLLDDDTGGLVSLGPVRADASYAVPDSLDLVELSTLDVSTEPDDGDPAHSGLSVLRGRLRWRG